ncbi:MAG: indole-3-glycerol-phosphate synthase TrpC, partial [Prevotella sp.]|nr:indole-3-glycerol-phosphate synthase TrpC [Prevotella sp.]
LPRDAVKVSESGISNPQTVCALRDAGFRGFLMGEHFMKTPNPGETLSAFIHELC